MNVILNRRKLEPDMRQKIRKRMWAEIHLVMAEVFGWDPRGDRMKRLDDFAKKFLEKYDTLYTDTRAEITAILNRIRAEGIDYDDRKGSGLKVEYAMEHDIAYLPYLLGLRKLFGYGKDRMQRMQEGVNDRTRYYNATFEGEYSAVLPTIENRLNQYGRGSKKA